MTTIQVHEQHGAAGASPRRPRMAWWRAPFSADTWRRTLYVLLVAPVSVVSVPLALGVYLWSIVPMNLAYPLRPGTMDSYQHSWGGPTLAGAWAVHAAGGLVMLWVAPWFVRGAAALQERLARRLLGTGPSGS